MKNINVECEHCGGKIIIPIEEDCDVEQQPVFQQKKRFYVYLTKRWSCNGKNIDIYVDWEKDEKDTVLYEFEARNIEAANEKVGFHIRKEDGGYYQCLPVD